MISRDPYFSDSFLNITATFTWDSSATITSSSMRGVVLGSDPDYSWLPLSVNSVGSEFEEEFYFSILLVYNNLSDSLLSVVDLICRVISSEAEKIGVLAASLLRYDRSSSRG